MQDKASYLREYWNRPGVRARQNALARARKKQPRNKAKMAAWEREYRKRPDVREKRLAQKRAWYQKNIERERLRGRSPEERERKRIYMREINRFRKYGLTREMFDEYLDAQEGCCAFCGELLPTGLVNHAHRISIDHDHQTGLFRGIVHQRCNFIIGQAETNDRFVGYIAGSV